MVGVSRGSKFQARGGPVGGGRGDKVGKKCGNDKGERTWVGRGRRDCEVEMALGS